MKVRCGKCRIIYAGLWTDEDESTGLCLICGPRAIKEALVEEQLVRNDMYHAMEY